MKDKTNEYVAVKIIPKKSSKSAFTISRLWWVHEVSPVFINTNPPNNKVLKRSLTIWRNVKFPQLLHHPITLRWRFRTLPGKGKKTRLTQVHLVAQINLQWLLVPCQRRNRTQVSTNLYSRDLKPANIMLSKGHVKIGDFGFAKKKYKSLKI